MTTVTRDATSGLWIPQNSSECTSLYAGRTLTIPNPDDLYLCQEASGSLADSVGSVPLNAAGLISYDQPVAGYSLKSVKFTDGNTTGLLSSTASPNLNANSWLRLALVDVPAPPTTRNMWLQGTSPFAFAQVTAAGNLVFGNNANSAMSTNSYSGPTLIAQLYDRTNTRSRGYTLLETVAPTYNGAVTGAKTTLGGGVVSVNGSVGFGYVQDRWGSHAELTDTQVAVLIDCHVNGPAVTSIAVTPTPFTISTIGGTQQLTATATRADGSTYDATSTATWTTSDATKATVSSSGLVTSVASGTATITASFTSLGASAASGTAACTVSTSVTLTSIAVTPTPTSIGVTTTRALTAIGTYSDSSTADLTGSATWTTSSGAIATVVTGVVTGVALGGPVTITATSGSISGTASVSVVTLVTPPTLYDPVPGNIGLIDDSTVLLHLEEPDGVYPADSAGGLENLTPLPGNYPATATATATAIGYGTWSDGWICDEVSGNLAPAFGSTTLMASGSPTYGNTGPIAGGAIGLTTTGDSFAAGNNTDLDAGATDDVVIAWVAKWATTPTGFATMFAKISSAFANGYGMVSTPGMGFYVGPSGDFISGQLTNYMTGRWHVGIAIMDRANGILQFGIMALDDGETAISATGAAPPGTVTSATPFKIGGGGWVGSVVGFEVAALYVGTGVGAASGVLANLATALANFAATLFPPPAEQVSTFCGHGRSFVEQGFTAADVVSGSTLELRDVSVQAILSWDLAAQATLATPGTIIARGKGGSGSEYVSYAVQLAVVDAVHNVGELSFWWQDSAGATHVELGGPFVLPSATDFLLLTWTRRWNSTTSVTCRYYAADLLLAEITSTDGDIAGGTTGTTTVGTRYASGTAGNFFCGVIDELRVVDYEMPASEVSATWQRLAIHQPNGVAAFAGLTPPGSRWAANPGNNIGALVKVAGELNGLVIAKTEELRANWLPDLAYTDFILRWEKVCGLAAKPRDSLDTRRARVIAFLSRTRGYSIPALQQAFSGVFDLDASDVQILQYANRVTDGFDTAIAPERWRIGSVGTWSIASGELEIAQASGADLRWDPTRADCHIRTAISRSALPVTPFGNYMIVVQGKLSTWHGTLPTNTLVGLLLYDRLTNDSLWFGIRNIAGTYTLGYQIFHANVLASFVTLATPTAVPYWLRVIPSGVGVHTFSTMSLGYSTTGPTTGFTDTSVNTTIVPPSSAGFAAMATDSSLATDLQATFDDFVLLAYNGDRPFMWYAFRDPALAGTPDMVGAQALARTARPAHTLAGVCQNTSVLCDDARDGLCDRGPLGGL